MSKRPSPAALTSEESASEAVVLAVAEAEETSPLNLRPLATVVDPEELDHLVQSMESDPASPTGQISFFYAGYEVTVTEFCDVSLEERRT